MTLRRAIAGFFFKALSSPLEKACRLLVVLVAAPMLGATAFGAFQFASTVTAMLAAGTELGLGTWTTRTLARDPASAGATMVTGLRLRALATLPYVVGLCLVTLTERTGEPRRAMLVFGAAALASSFVDYFGAIFRGREDFRREATMNAMRAVLTTAGALGGLRVAPTLMGLASGVALGALASVVCSTWFLQSRYAELTSRGVATAVNTREVARGVFREALPLWLSGLLAMLYFRSDIILVRYFAGEAEVGAYAASYRIFEATMMLPSAVLAVGFPRLARAGDPERATRLELWIVLLLAGLGLLVASCLYFADDRIVLFLLGKTFGRSVPSLHVLALTVPVMFVSYALSFFVIARGRERSFVKVLGVMLVLNVGLNLVLVPRLGGTGAAWSTLVTELALIVACVGIVVMGKRSGSPTVASP